MDKAQIGKTLKVLVSEPAYINFDKGTNSLGAASFNFAGSQRGITVCR
jgi:hypothetical protein